MDSWSSWLHFLYRVTSMASKSNSPHCIFLSQPGASGSAQSELVMPCESFARYYPGGFLFFMFYLQVPWSPDIHCLGWSTISFVLLWKNMCKVKLWALSMWKYFIFTPTLDFCFVFFFFWLVIEFRLELLALRTLKVSSPLISVLHLECTGASSDFLMSCVNPCLLGPFFPELQAFTVSNTCDGFVICGRHSQSVDY